MNKVMKAAFVVIFSMCVVSWQLQAGVVNITQGSTSGYTMTSGNTYIVKNSVTFSNSTVGGSGMSVADNATVVLYIPAGVALTARGANGSGQTGGGAGIRVPQTATLVITGEGIVNAAGGDAGNGGNGANGGNGYESVAMIYAGAGGNGGSGGGGAGAGIGGKGGDCKPNAKDGESMGSVYILGSMNIETHVGLGGVAGAAGSPGNGYSYTFRTGYASGGGGGGGGGAGSPPAFSIGGGGPAGGSGGAGMNGQTSYSGSVTAPGKGGKGGGSATIKGNDASNSEGGNDGYAAGAEGGAGTLYVSPTATVNVNRAKLSATTHSAAQYTITFDANGGDLSSSDESVTATLGCELPNCIPSPARKGYLFDGWRTATGEEYYGASGEKSESSYSVVGNVTLYAQWQLDETYVDHTVTTPEEVPYSFFDNDYPSLLAEYGGDYEAAALATAANGHNKVWECFVAGISPTNETSRFSAKIEMRDGLPVLMWEPDLNENGSKAERLYKVYGKESLRDMDWVYPTNSLHRFFKVTVEMP